MYKYVIKCLGAEFEFDRITQTMDCIRNLLMAKNVADINIEKVPMDREEAEAWQSQF